MKPVYSVRVGPLLLMWTRRLLPRWEVHRVTGGWCVRLGSGVLQWADAQEQGEPGAGQS